eukprot:Amastigsp_a174380_19.p4 type:complete len:139 gc:universal Amastigsp_a174380_19:952-1368(+)
MSAKRKGFERYLLRDNRCAVSRARLGLEQAAPTQRGDAQVATRSSTQEQAYRSDLSNATMPKRPLGAPHKSDRSARPRDGCGQGSSQSRARVARFGADHVSAWLRALSGTRCAAQQTSVRNARPRRSRQMRPFLGSLG